MLSSIHHSASASLTTSLASPLASLLQSNQLWHADALVGSDASVCASGFEALDRVLPFGGWPCSSLIEVLTDASASTDWSLIMPALPALLAPQHSLREPQLVLIDPPHEPCLAALASAQMDLRNILRIDTRIQPGEGTACSAGPARACWAVEQALHCAQVAVVLAWLPRVPAASLRRLQVAAASGRALLMVFRPSGSLSHSHVHSPAPLRLSLQRLSALQCEISILKCKGLAGEHSVCVDLLNPSFRALLQAPKRRRAYHDLDRTPSLIELPTSPQLAEREPQRQPQPRRAHASAERSQIRAARLARSH
jgi:protein ImuA